MDGADEDLLECIALGLAPQAPASARPLQLRYLRDMSEADAHALTAPEAPRVPALLLAGRSPAEQMRYRHHLLAKSLARGATDVEAAAETGYALETIRGHKASPAFRELLAYYESQHEVRHLEVAERRTHVGVQALEELAERLDDPARREAIPTQELRRIVESTLGRIGQGPSGPALVPVGGALGGGLTLNVQFVAPPAQGGPSGSPVIELEANRDGEIVG